MRYLLLTISILCLMTACSAESDRAPSPIKVEIEKTDSGYRLVVLPALEDFPGDDIEVASARVNRAIEEMVYACPEQYLWSHKRFKTQPDRKTNIYA